MQSEMATSEHDLADNIRVHMYLKNLMLTEYGERKELFDTTLQPMDLGEFTVIPYLMALSALEQQTMIEVVLPEFGCDPISIGTTPEDCAYRDVAEIMLDDMIIN